VHLLEVVVVTVLLWHINAAIPENDSLLMDKLFIEGVFLGEPGASRDLAHSPTSDSISSKSYNIKALCNLEIIQSCKAKKQFLILLQFLTVLLL
jgi:hypothetical protein